MLETKPGPETALLIVDPQNDFCPGGTLAVKDGDRIMPVLNRLIVEDFQSDPKRIFVSRDWHQPAAAHFKGWPVHCVQNTPGAEFHPDLILPDGVTVISKGMDPVGDAYSAFEGLTDAGIPLEQELRSRGITHLVIGGLATDYCVKATVLDARRWFRVTVIRDACRAVNKNRSTDGEEAFSAMLRDKVVLT